MPRWRIRLKGVVGTMKTLATIVTLLLLIGARTVAAQDVRYDFDKDKAFSRFKTYKYVGPTSLMV
jgi:hypothetical protein